MRVLHNNIFHVALFFDDFCRKHRLSYYLLGGTALGAERHGGFIPWDDDFDVCMTKSDYRRFLSLSDELQNSDFYLQKENTSELPLFFSKVRLNHSEYFEKDDFGKEMHHGVYIDVMCLSPSYSSNALTFLQYLASKILSAKALAARGYADALGYKKLFLGLAGLIPSRLVPFLLAFARNDIDFKTGESHVHFFGRAPFTKGIIKNIHLEPSSILFEGHEFSCFARNKEYLVRRFGNDCFSVPSKIVRSQYPTHCVRFVSNPHLNSEL